MTNATRAAIPFVRQAVQVVRLLIAMLAACAGSEAAAGTVAYSYDAAGRLVAVDYGSTQLGYTYDAAGNVLAVAVNSSALVPGSANIASNPYGALTVQGATLNGNSISNLQGNAVIQLGATPGAAGSFIELDFQGFSVALGNTLTIKSGAGGQSVVLRNLDGAASVIGGTVTAQSGNGAAPPSLTLQNPNGITINGDGAVVAPGGLTVSALSNGSASTGQPVVNQGMLDGGAALSLFGSRITGSGAFKGDTILISSFGNINNPVNGLHFLGNSIRLFPSTGASTSVTLNDYGTSPQVLNIAINGNASVAMPSGWPNGSSLPPNNAPVPAGGTRAAGTPAPGFGGGSMIVQATGNLTLNGATTNDFAFAGGIVLRSGGTLDLHGVIVNQGWTTAGKAFQGVFFEAPAIASSAGVVQVYSNALNFINFSVQPTAHVKTYQLTAAADGSAQYVAADSIAAHMNTYSLLAETAAVGGCWVCLVSTTPINVQ